MKNLKVFLFIIAVSFANPITAQDSQTIVTYDLTAETAQNECTVDYGETVTLVVEASCSYGPLYYTWHYSNDDTGMWYDMPDETGSTLEVTVTEGRCHSHLFY